MLPADLELAGGEAAYKHPSRMCLLTFSRRATHEMLLVLLDSAPKLGVLPFAALVAGDGCSSTPRRRF